MCPVFCPGFGFHVSRIVKFFWPKNGKCPGFRGIKKYSARGSARTQRVLITRWVRAEPRAEYFLIYEVFGKTHLVTLLITHLCSSYNKPIHIGVVTRTGARKAAPMLLILCPEFSDGSKD